MGKKKILITGGAGFIGINAANYFFKKNYEVILLDNFSRKGSRENVAWLLETTKNAPKVIEADIVTDKKILNAAVANSDIVLHLAAQVAVTKSIQNPLHDFRVNLLGTIHILESIRKATNPPILLYSSTNKVYGDLTNVAVKEESIRYKLKDFPNGIAENQPTSFKSPYGCSKGASDQYIHDYHTIYGLRTVVFRQSCIYGPHQFGIEDQGWVAWFIIALLLGKKITIYGNGKQVRDLLYVDDLVEAYYLAIKHIDKTSGQIYNLGGGNENSTSIWIELQPILEKIFDKELTVNFSKERPGDQKIFISDNRKAKKEFNWGPKVHIEEGLNILYRWAKKNKPMLEKYFIKE